MTLPIRYIIIEGPDCSGKTSLCASLNKSVGFVRNIRDRSYLSTLCYSILYSRSVADELRSSLHEELCDANNFFVIMLPDKDVILRRLAERGDEYQDSDSIVRLHSIFEEETNRLAELPNVIVVREELRLDDLTSHVKNRMLEYESHSPASVGDLLHHWTSLSKNKEVQFKIRLNVPRDYCDQDVLEDPRESDYFKDILNSCSLIIDSEKSGKNPYGIRQKDDSRRFYYCSNTCISSIHFMPRDGDLKVICTLRSTDSVRNGNLDLRFLSHMSTVVAERHGWSSHKIILDVSYNSLHVRLDKI